MLWKQTLREIDILIFFVLEVDWHGNRLLLQGSFWCNEEEMDEREKAQLLFVKSK